MTLDLDAVRARLSVSCDRCRGSGYTESMRTGADIECGGCKGSGKIVDYYVAALMAEIERLRGQRQTPGATAVATGEPRKVYRCTHTSIPTPKPAPRRTKAEVLEERKHGSCCNRYGDNMGCNCLSEAVDDKPVFRAGGVRPCRPSTTPPYTVTLHQKDETETRVFQTLHEMIAFVKPIQGMPFVALVEITDGRGQTVEVE